ncbi:MAG TPA: zinc ribbon domain-containing protein [Saccharofermentans sp.]|nr:zinc ribbon domain-containing protein [Saccharofermentans sp.]
MVDITKLCCPNCGGNEFEEISSSKLACNYCGSISIYTSDSDNLEVKGWRCPSCKTINPVNSKFCGKCGVRITKHCPKCGEDVQHFSNYCTSCSYEFYPGEFTIADCDTVGMLINEHLTLTNKRICGLSSTGYYEVLLGNIANEKHLPNKCNMLEFKNIKGKGKIKLFLHPDSKFPAIFMQTLKKYR